MKLCKELYVRCVILKVTCLVVKLMSYKAPVKVPDKVPDKVQQTLSKKKNNKVLATGSRRTARIQTSKRDSSSSNDIQFVMWCRNNVVYKPDSIMRLLDVVTAYDGKKPSPKVYSTRLHDLEYFIKTYHPDKEIDPFIQHTSFQGLKYRGWLHFTLEKTIQK